MKLFTTKSKYAHILLTMHEKQDANTKCRNFEFLSLRSPKGRLFLICSSNNKFFSGISNMN